MAELLEPKDFDVTTQSGETKTYVLSKIPYLACREVITQYPIGAMPKIGDYKLNEAMARRLFSYVAIRLADDKLVRLETDALINNHIPDLLTGGRVELGMIEYQVGFSVTERLSNSLNGFARSLMESISKTLTQSPAPSSTAEKQAS